MRQEENCLPDGACLEEYPLTDLGCAEFLRIVGEELDDGVGGAESTRLRHLLTRSPVLLAHATETLERTIPLLHAFGAVPHLVELGGLVRVADVGGVVRHGNCLSVD